MLERRTFQRVPIELPASFVSLQTDNILQTATIINISGGGFCFHSNAKLDLGSEVQLMIWLDSNEKITINVKVTWSQGVKEAEEYINGVSITDAATPDFDKFLDFYSKQLQNL